MNKIKDGTYLYNEIDKYIKEMGLKGLVITYNKDDNCKIEKNILYVLDSVLIENIRLYNKLFKSKWEYIIPGTFDKIQINNNEYTNILNIGKKCSIYALFNENASDESISYIVDYIAVIVSDDIIVNKVINIKNGFEIIDIALEKGKDIYAIPGEIFNSKNYLANYVIKQGAIPICDISDIKYILLQKHYKRV